jgi:hypothetical protein
MAHFDGAWPGEDYLSAVRKAHTRERETTMSINYDLWTVIGLAGVLFVHVQPSAAQSAVKSGVDRVGQPWTITIARNIPQDQLPKTNDMKMASFEPATYIERACGDGWKESRCDVYVQPDADGSLTGYLIIQQYDGRLSFKTDTMTTSKSVYARSCSLGGSLKGEHFDPGGKNYRVIENLDPTGSWKARSPFETKSAKGMMYVEKVGDKLRVNDERWNYCYPDRHIDDVYVLVGSLVRKLDPSRWPATPK